MPAIGLNGPEFTDLARWILGGGHWVRFQARGGSMQPLILDGDILKVAPLLTKRVHHGDVVLVEAGEGRLLAHRVVKITRSAGEYRYLIKSDVSSNPDGWFRRDDILGRVEVVERGPHHFKLTAGSHQWKVRAWLSLTPFAARFTWLPEGFRRRIRRWLLVD